MTERQIDRYWSREREGVRIEYDALGEEWAKIKVKIRFCNQFDKDYIADD
jgi:hypothetical protein